MPRTNITLLQGDCREALQIFPDNHFHACVTDPPAGISFMNRAWDSDRGGRQEWIGWLGSVFAEVKRTLRPGGHLAVWALPRTSHWTATALEDAGLELRDCLYHIFGQGFPKSADAAKLIDNHLGIEREVIGTKVVDIGMQGGKMHADRPHLLADRPSTIATSQKAKVWEGYGTALKPAVECWWIARKPLDGTIAENILKWGTGALNIDSSRIPGIAQKPWGGVHPNRGKHPSWQLDDTLVPAPDPNPKGRWPANVVFSHSEDCIRKGTKTVTSDRHHPLGGNRSDGAGVGKFGMQQKENHFGEDYQPKEEEVEDWECVSDCAVLLLNEQAGDRKAGGQPDRRFADKFRTAYGDFKGSQETNPGQGRSSGSASRFFYCAKADSNQRAFYCTKCSTAYLMDAEHDHLHGASDRSHLIYHPTVKPEDLVSWLVKMVTPQGGIVLDPFVGSGTTCVVASNLGFESVGLDLEAAHIAIAKRRCGIDVRGPLDRFPICSD